jgi:AAA15 family ATPase/GTPase
MVHVVDYLLALNQAKGGIVAIDEIDTGIHYSSMQDVWRAMKRMADLTGTQVFATTHSRECLSAAREAFGRSDAMRLYRMSRGAGDTLSPVQAISYDDDERDAAAKMGLELR